MQHLYLSLVGRIKFDYDRGRHSETALVRDATFVLQPLPASRSITREDDIQSRELEMQHATVNWRQLENTTVRLEVIV